MRRAGPSPRPAGRTPWVAVVGARPNYPKLAPLVRAAAARGRKLLWIDTGQHPDEAMSRAMWRDLGLPPALRRLDPPAAGPARMSFWIERLVTALEDLSPRLVVVVGDADSTAAGAASGWVAGAAVAHVEAGLRTFERNLPEERNRMVVDRLARLHHATELSGVRHLVVEGIEGDGVHLAGNTMADALAAAAPALERARIPLPAEIGDRPYLLATLHRQATADDPGRLERYLSAFGRLAAKFPVVFPVHPRTRKTIASAHLEAPPGVFLLDPQPYLSFLALLKGARLVVTDSGGVQIEAGILGVPCVTARARTEHRITLELGLNRLAGADPRRLPRVVEAALSAPAPRVRLPKAWDGKASERIVDFWIQAEERGLI